MPSLTPPKPYVLRWGILGCGWVSTQFVKDLVTNPEERGTTDVSHAVTIVGSRTLSKAEEFIANLCPEGACAQKTGLVNKLPDAKGSYAEVYHHPDVDIIYVGTPHTSHYDDAKAALDAGKHVLLEKPATLNAAEFASLVTIAESKRLFLMEAVWTRFFPITYAIQDLLFKDAIIGDVKRVFCDFSMDFLNNVRESHRLRDPLLAGGGLLDLGPYPLVWAMLTLFQHPSNDFTPPTKISGTMIKDDKGIDVFTDFTLDFPKIGTSGARACLSCSIAVNSPKDAAVRIQGTKGEIIIPHPAPRPTSFTIRHSKVSQGPADYVEEVREFPIPGQGMHWEADACARDIRDGKIENERMPWKETMLTMRIFDEVRKQGGYVYPEGLERVRGV